jgi:hypothetical protein
MQVNWSVRSPNDILERIQQLLPGENLEDQVNTMFKSLAKRARADMVRFQHPAPHAAVKALLSVLGFRYCRTILDP